MSNKKDELREQIARDLEQYIDIDELGWGKFDSLIDSIEITATTLAQEKLEREL